MYIRVREGLGDDTDVTPEIILIAGANYPKFDTLWKRSRKLSAGPWRKFCCKLAEHRLKANPKLKVTLFDFLLGTRENVTLSATNRAVTTVEKSFTAPMADDYWNLVGINWSEPTVAQVLSATLVPANKSTLSKKPQVAYFDGATALSKGKSIKLVDYLSAVAQVPSPVISITDVYAYIEGFATSGKKGALLEFHFFAHAFNVSSNQYSGGPILLNSLDNPMQADRHPLDKDARAGKDFTKPTMNPAVFAQAFAANAQSFVWGCNFQRGFIRQFVHQVGKNSKDLAAGKTMKISHNSDWGAESEFRTRLGLSATASVKNVKVDLAKVEQILRDANQSTYMQKLATTSGHPAVGGPPGTYADYDGSSSPLELMHIPMSGDPFRETNVSFERALLFLRDHLGLDFDTSFGNHNDLGRGYMIYKP